MRRLSLRWLAMGCCGVLLGIGGTYWGVRTVLAQPPGIDSQVLKKRSIVLDFDVDADKKTAIHSIELYTSRDGGVWELAATAKPDEKSIGFTVKEDGVYLVNMATVYKTGVRDPADPTKAAPLQRLLIDSTAPVVVLKTAERSGDEIRVGWSVEERNPSDAKTKLEWKATGESELSWKPVAINSPERRSATFNPGVAGAITVRVTVEDIAGNATTQSKDIGTTSTRTSEFLSTNVAAPSELKLPTGDTMTLPAITPPSIAPPAMASPSAPVLDLTKNVVPASVPSIAPPMLSATPIANVAPPPSAIAPAAVAPIAMGSGLGASGTAPIATDQPPAKIIGALKFDVPYQLEAGPSGISKIELYVTRDEGRSWVKWSVHEGEQKPLRVALDQRSNVQPEGIYGFRLVPISGAGLSDHPPSEGATPDFRVNVDISPPLIKVYQPEANLAQPGVLTLKWEIKDKNPAKDGVAIAWSETQAGPWKSIGSETTSAIVAGVGTETPVRLPDTGSFTWKLPEKIPAKVYLKMTAWDAAGNRSEVSTPNPVLVDLVRPRAKIQDIVPVGGFAISKTGRE